MDSDGYLFKKLKQMADEVPLGVSVGLSFHFRQESPGYEKQPAKLMQHIQMENRKLKSSSADLLSDCRSESRQAGMPLTTTTLAKCPTSSTSYQTLSSQTQQTDKLFPPADYIRLGDMRCKKSEPTNNLYEQVQVDK